MSDIRLLIHDEPYKAGITKPYEGVNVEECSICISNDEFTYKSWVELKCGHCFHRHCIDLWLENHRTCPICVQDVYNKHGMNENEKINENIKKMMWCCVFSVLCIIIVVIISYYIYKKNF